MRIYSIGLIINTFCCFLFFSNSHLNSQRNLEGSIVSVDSQTPIAYASIFNNRTSKGTISNIEGYFKLQNCQNGDTIIVSYLGFQTKTIQIQELSIFHTISLQEQAYLLDEISIVAEDTRYLYKLLADCKKHKSKFKYDTKAYYELKSYIDERQVELVEAFFNIQMFGGEIISTLLKTGRLALQKYRKNLFTSLSTSRAINMINIYEDKKYLPSNPLMLSKKKIQQEFYIDLENTFKNDNADSIMIIRFSPKDTLEEYFSGKVWINLDLKQVLKIELKIENTTRHPFESINKTDEIKDVDFFITLLYREIEEELVFSHIDFEYTIHYKDNEGREFDVRTNSVLHTYESERLFQIPRSIIALKGDYNKIVNLPYNDYFWSNSEELRLNDQYNENERFFTHPKSITNVTKTGNSRVDGRKIIEPDLKIWARERVPIDKLNVEYKDEEFNSTSPETNFDIHLLVDLNFYPDTIQLRTFTLYDEERSYIKRQYKEEKIFFFNLLFDLIEIERRKLISEINNSNNNYEAIISKIESTLINEQNLKNEFFKIMHSRDSQKKMREWDRVVFQHLGIDNFDIFDPYNVKKAIRDVLRN